MNLTQKLTQHINNYTWTAYNGTLHIFNGVLFVFIVNYRSQLELVKKILVLILQYIYCQYTI